MTESLRAPQLAGMTTWHPIADIPDDRKDGRPMLIRHGEKPWERIARWSPNRWWEGRGAWVTPDATLLDVQAWADPDQSG